MGVEALIHWCCPACSARRFRDFAFQAVVAGSSLIFGEVESGDDGERSGWRGDGFIANEHLRSGIWLVASSDPTANRQHMVCFLRMSS